MMSHASANSATLQMLPENDGFILPNVAYLSSLGLVPYPEAMEAMEQRVDDIINERATECLWFLEHPPLYTSGTSAKQDDMLDAKRFPTYQSGRGGQITYHGPGQRVVYAMLDLKKRFAPEDPDIRAYVHKLEAWIIESLAQFGITGEIRDGRVGVWVNTPTGGEAKIAAIGIRVRKWVAYHGISLNVQPDLGHYQGIVPCGIREFGVTSLAQLGINASMSEVDTVLTEQFRRTFG